MPFLIVLIHPNAAAACDKMTNFVVQHSIGFKMVVSVMQCENRWQISICFWYKFKYFRHISRSEHWSKYEVVMLYMYYYDSNYSMCGLWLYICEASWVNKNITVRVNTVWTTACILFILKIEHLFPSLIKRNCCRS